MKRNIFGIVATVSSLIVMPQILSAQYEKRISPKDSIALVNAAAVADTGRMIPGLQDLKAYSTPTYCLRLLETAQGYVWRSSERDTLFADIDSIPTFASQKGRECISKFTPQTVRKDELYSYMQAASILKDTALIRSIVNVVVSKDSVKDGVTNWYKINFLSAAANLGYAATKPELTDFVSSILNDLMKYGNEAIPSVAAAYDVIKDHYYQRFDTTQLIATAKKRAEYLSQFSEKEFPKENGLRDKIYRDSLILVWFNRGPNFAADAKRLLELATASMENDPFTIMEREISELKTTKLGGLPSDMELVAAFPATASAVPQKGKVTVYYRLPYGTNANNTVPPLLAKFRRLYEKYGPEKLEIVLVTTLRGFMWDSPPLEPEAESKLQNWYYRQYHNLPFTILINKQALSKRRDGRILRDRPLFDDFLEGSRVFGYVVGKDGNVQAFQEGFLTPEVVVGKYIERELAK